MLSDKYFKGHVMEAIAEVSVTKVIGTFNQVTQQVNFGTGIKAQYNEEYVKDALVGTIVWQRRRFQCLERVSHVYQGQAELHTNLKSQAQSLKDSVVLVQNKATNQFAGLKLQQQVNVCSRKCHGTQINGVLVCILTPAQPAVFSRFQDRFDTKEANLMTLIGFQVLQMQFDTLKT